MQNSNNSKIVKNIYMRLRLRILFGECMTDQKKFATIFVTIFIISTGGFYLINWLFRLQYFQKSVILLNKCKQYFKQFLLKLAIRASFSISISCFKYCQLSLKKICTHVGFVKRTYFFIIEFLKKARTFIIGKSMFQD